jgi:hypothetical protein
LTITGVRSEVRAVLTLKLANDGFTTDITAALNGQALPEKHRLDKSIWGAGWTEARWAVTLRPGENQFDLRASCPETVLPGGRTVAFMLVGEPEITTRD